MLSVPLASIFADEKAAVNLTEYPLYMMSYFSLVACKVVFGQFVFGVEIFEFILFEFIELLGYRD